MTPSITPEIRQEVAEEAGPIDVRFIHLEEEIDQLVSVVGLYVRATQPVLKPEEDKPQQVQGGSVSAEEVSLLETRLADLTRKIVSLRQAVSGAMNRLRL